MSPSKARERMKQIIPNMAIDNKLKASEFIKKYWAIYLNSFTGEAGIDGTVFEEMIAITLIRNNILPFYMQATVAFINNSTYDFIIYTEDLGPISLSAKISLRERWKQADLEAFALKNIHRQSKSYLLTLNEKEAKTRKENIGQCMALDNFILADSPEYDDLINEIKQHKLITAGSVEIVSSPVILDKDRCETWYN